MARRHQWNPLADEDRYDMDVELIDLACIQKGRDQPSATTMSDRFGGGIP
jgi:hypothetical protein